MSDISISNGEQRMDLQLPGGRRIVVICRWKLGGQVPSLGLPKPKSVLARVALDDDLVVDMEMQAGAPA